MAGNLKVIDPKTDPRWDEFVRLHPLGTIYHHSAWREVLLATYDFVPFYVAIESGDRERFEGVLPFMLVKSRLTGNRLVSLPFSCHCSPLVSASSLEAAVQFALNKHPGIEFLEMKCPEQIVDAPAFLESQTKYVTHVLNLETGPEWLFKSFHSTGIRQRIRRAERDHVTVRMAEDEKDLKEFYKLLITVRRKHGLPPPPYAFFANMWRILRPANLLFMPLVEHGGEIIAGGITLGFKDTFYFEYSASDQEKLALSPNQLLIWEIIKIACSKGAKYFDFGRSSATHQTLIEFKERWGARRKDLVYYYHPKANRMDIDNSLKRRLLSNVNKRLPDFLLTLEGELLYPHLG